MKKQLIFLVLALTLTSLNALAQDNYFYIAYDVSKPTSNGWLEATNSRGWRMGYHGFLNSGNRISVGLDVNWSQFDQYQPYETYPSSNGATSTDYFKYIYQYGATVTGHYYFPVGNGEILFPFAGLGLGANYNEYLIYYNVNTFGEKKWGFVTRPEAGILIRFGAGRSLGALAAVHYDFSTNSSDQFDVSNFSAVGFRVGLMFMDR